MRYEIDKNTITVYDNYGNTALQQSHDPRTGKAIETQEEAESVAEYLLEVVEESFPEPAIDLTDLKASKLTEVGAACNAAIFAGVDVNTTHGTEHFALTLNDQTNISNLALQAQSGESVLYHADGELCRWFTAEEILAIVKAATEHKVYHTTRCNHYNVWIRRETDIDVLNGITYGSPLPADLADSMAALLGGDGGG